MSNLKCFVLLLVLFTFGFFSSNSAQETPDDNFLTWSELPQLPPVPGDSIQLGVAGPFAGISNDALIIAGGANFPRPFWETEKIYFDHLFVLTKTQNRNEQIQYKWYNNFKLDYAVAYGASVSSPFGVVCMGGANGKNVFSNVFLLNWNSEENKIIKQNLPDLPSPCVYGYATIIENVIYFAGGQSGLGLETAMTNFWSLDLSQLLIEKNSDFEWQELPPWPGLSRALNITVAQHSGETMCVYVISGRRYKTNESSEYEFEFLNDVYEFNPTKYDPQFYKPQAKEYSGKGRYANPWRKRAYVPTCVMAGTGIDVGQSHIFVLGGADGSLMSLINQLKDDHPGFPKKAYAYHTITDTWINAGSIPANQVATIAFKWDENIIIPSGEIRPRVRSPKIWQIQPTQSDNNFGWLNFTTLGLYLFGMVGIGVYVAKKNKSTNDYFRGGQQIPWWAAGCSIFATMLSSITYMSVPAKAYAANWEYVVGYPIIFLTAIFVIYLVLPFFRQIDATSAYEYLEKRFNMAARLIGSSFFILFQIGRMAIVMFLSALALAAITPFSDVDCILIMGILSIIYCALGGIEAVIWTDTIQTFVLLGGALLIFILILFNIDGGISGFFSVAASDQKFHAFNWNWDLFSYTTAAVWVLILGAIGQNLVSYTSDQAVVQRYMTTSDHKKAAKSIWTNGLLSLPAGLLFFVLGTALFVFYKNNPTHLDPTFKTDAIMPLFVAREIPVGIAGLIVAGIFAAAQSTISTSMNSTATALVTDFFRPFNFLKSDKAYLNLARLMTAVFGIAGTGIAILFSSANVKSLLDQFFAVIGLFGGSLGGLFLLGMFTRRANGPGAVIGTLVGASALYLVRTFTGTHFYLYAFVGVSITMLVGYFASLLITTQPKDLFGLTYFTRLNKSA